MLTWWEKLILLFQSFFELCFALVVILFFIGLIAGMIGFFFGTIGAVIKGLM